MQTIKSPQKPWFGRPKLWLLDSFDVLSRPEVIIACVEPILRLIRGESAPEQIKLSQARRILVVQPDLIGDVLMTTPFLRELRQNAPEANITLITDKIVSNLVELCPHVDRFVAVDSNGWKLRFRWKFARNAFVLCVSNLLWQKYDLVVFPHWGTDQYYASLICYLSGAKTRVAYSEQVCEEKRESNKNYDKLFTHLFQGFPTTSISHESENYLSLISFMGGSIKNASPEMFIDNLDRQAAAVLLGKKESKRLRVAVCLGASHARKRWPVEFYQQVMDQIAKKHAVQFVVVGSKSEIVLARQLKGDFIDCVGKTTLRECAAVMEKCDVYLGNDTAPMHMAAAMGLAVVAISCHPLDGSLVSAYSPNRFGPRTLHSSVLQPVSLQGKCAVEVQGQKFCRHASAHCIRSVSVVDATAAVSKFLSRSKIA
jgi:ADP-heptose:LPS heptosyltransferase